jgi:hypothetical protein
VGDEEEEKPHDKRRERHDKDKIERRVFSQDDRIRPDEMLPSSSSCAPVKTLLSCLDLSSV